jgi:hypothetical protein
MTPPANTTRKGKGGIKQGRLCNHPLTDKLLTFPPEEATKRAKLYEGMIKYGFTKTFAGIGALGTSIEDLDTLIEKHPASDARVRTL